MAKVVKNLPASRGDARDMGSIPGLGRSAGGKIVIRQPIPIFLPGKFHGQKSLVGYSPWDCKQLDMTEQAHAMPEVKEQTCLVTRTVNMRCFPLLPGDSPDNQDSISLQMRGETNLPVTPTEIRISSSENSSIVIQTTV